MKRLTVRPADRSGLWLEKGVTFEALAFRLAAYEDTGLEPSELDDLCRKISRIRVRLGIKTLDELDSILQNGQFSPSTENSSDTTIWIHEWIESKSGDWGRSGRTRCEKCRGEGQTDFRFCPWCGRKATGSKTVTVLKDGETYE